MKKLFFAVLSVMLACHVAWGAQVFTTTIRNTSVEQIQDVAIEYMMEKNFAVDRVEEYTLTFTKGFGDGLFGMASRNMIVKFNMLQRGDNVRLMVTQIEDSPQLMLKGQRSVDHLIPLVKDIRHLIDGTPTDQIENEATDQQPGSKKAKKGSAAVSSKTSGPVSSGLSFDGPVIKDVAPGSIAEKCGLQPGDRIVEVNARPADENALKDIDARLSTGRSVTVTYERNGSRDMTTLRAK